MNQIILVPTKQHNIFNVKLNLPFQSRFIGRLDVTGQGTFTTSRKPEHLFRKNNSLGINYSLLTDNNIFFKWIVIQFENHSLVTSRDYFLKFGKCFKFQNSGSELQVFLPLSEFGIEKARYYEAKRLIQQNLFAGVM